MRKIREHPWKSAILAVTLLLLLLYGLSDIFGPESVKEWIDRGLDRLLTSGGP